MATVDVKPLVLKDVELVIDEAGDDYRKHVSAVTLTPSSSQQTWVGLGGNSHTDSTTPTWTVQIDYVQDWDTSGSLSRFLLSHTGQTLPIEFRPRSGEGPSFTTDVSVVPGAIGGQVNAFATTSVTLGCNAPVLVEPES